MTNKFFIHATDVDDEYMIEWVHKNIRFIIWFDNNEAGWCYVDNNDTQDYGNIELLILKKIYKKIGKILENEGKEIE
jgi:hypothetical protein